MAVIITVPDNLEAQLERTATAQELSVEQVALNILSDALEIQGAFPTPEEVVATIKALAPNPHNIRPARGSLAEALRNAPDDPTFDLARWEQEWAGVEAEMKAITRANDIAEGRG